MVLSHYKFSNTISTHDINLWFELQWNNLSMIGPPEVKLHAMNIAGYILQKQSKQLFIFGKAIFNLFHTNFSIL